MNTTAQFHDAIQAAGLTPPDIIEADGKLRMERFCPDMTFKRPMDIELGPDGCLYVLENGTAWNNNKDTQIIRLEYTGAH